MLDTLLAPAVADEEAVVKARALNLLALTTAVVVPAYALLTAILTPGQITLGAAAALGGAFLLSLGCYWLAKQGRVRVAAYVLFVGIFAAISLYVTDPGNKVSDLLMAPVLYILVILPAGYVLHPLASFVVATLAAAYITGFLILTPPPAFVAYPDKPSFWSNVVLAFALSYILSAIAWVFSRGIRDALRHTRRQNRELEGAARELEEKRRVQASTGRQIMELAERLAHYSSSQARGSSRQAAAVGQVSASVKELEQAAREIAQSAGAVDEAARQTLHEAQEGQDVLVRSDEAMAMLRAKAQEGATQSGILSEQLAQVNNVATIMSDIASQIQLVAFNATLEAAEAGEAGQRFSVVAAEVKDLAADSLKQARQVAGIAREVQEAGEAVVILSGEQVQAVREGSALTRRSSAANQAIRQSASHVAERATQIQQATVEQQQVSEQVAASMQEIKAVVDRWVVNSYQMDDMVASLRALAEQLA